MEMLKSGPNWRFFLFHFIFYSIFLFSSFIYLLKLELLPENVERGPNCHFFYLQIGRMTMNKANLRDLIAATGLVILLNFDPNHRFFSPCDLEI